MQAIKDGPLVRWATVAPFQICYLRTTHVMQQRERERKGQASVLLIFAGTIWFGAFGRVLKTQ